LDNKDLQKLELEVDDLIADIHKFFKE